MVIAFITFISNSGDANQPQMGIIKAKAMSLWSRCYERVAKAYKHQAPYADEHKVHAIGRCEMGSRVYTYSYGKNWNMLSTTG